MMTKDEIMKVLDAMNYAISPSGTFWVKKHNEAKQILQSALAEPSDPIVGTRSWYENGKLTTINLKHSEVYKPEPQVTTDNSATLQNALAEIERLKAENAAIRTLMDCYNVGGWTDSLTLIQERDKCKAALRVALECLEKVWLLGDHEAMLANPAITTIKENLK